MALAEAKGPVTLAQISNTQDISLAYLEQLFVKLRKHRLVDGVRGPGGGYRLARESNRISIAEIIEAVDERVDVDDLHKLTRAYRGILNRYFNGSP